MNLFKTRKGVMVMKKIKIKTLKQIAALGVAVVMIIGFGVVSLIEGRKNG